MRHLALVAVVSLIACGGGKKQVENPDTDDTTTTVSVAPTTTPTEPETESLDETEPAPPEPQYFYGKFVFFEHWVKSKRDAKRARAFYSKVLGWKFENRNVGGMDFMAAKSGDSIIALSAIRPKHKGKAEWMGYISVPNVDEAFMAAKGYGGKVVLEPTDFPDVGRYAQVRDPSGATVGLFHAPNGDLPHEAAETGQFAWVEVWAKDASVKTKVVDFYTTFGYVEDTFGDQGYSMLAYRGSAWAGVEKAPNKRVAGKLVPYISVDDVDATVKKARRARGKIVIKANDVEGVGRFAVVSDPTGGLIGFIKPEGSRGTVVGDPVEESDQPAPAPEPEPESIGTPVP